MSWLFRWLDHGLLSAFSRINKWYRIIYGLENFASRSQLGTNPLILSYLFLKLYVPCIVTYYINKPTSCTFRMYLFYNFLSNSTCYHFVHHQEFRGLLYLQLCTNRANVSNCLVLKPRNCRINTYEKCILLVCLYNYVAYLANFWRWLAKYIAFQFSVENTIGKFRR